MNTYYSILTFANLVGWTLSSKILFVQLASSSSHRTAIWPLAEELANLGHNLTYIYPIPGIKVGSHPQIEEITPSKVVPLLKSFDINIRLNGSYYNWILNTFKEEELICEAFYDSPEVEDWLQTPNLSYDLLFIDTIARDCAFGLVQRFQARHIIFSSALPPFNLDPYGIVPDGLPIRREYRGKTEEMPFISRVTSSLIALLATYYRSTSNIHEMVKGKMKFSNFPPFDEFELNTSLIFVNNYFIDGYPLQFPPLVQSYSGLWCSKKYVKKGTTNLPENMERFIQSGEDGFIYVSFGTTVDPSLMPQWMRSELFQALEAFPKLRFLVKWNSIREDDIFPKNVFVQKWFPQRTILGHPLIRGFINQAGRPSLQEAFCYNVPIINIPVFGDQPYNANRLEQLELSIVISIHNFSGAELTNAIHEILENPKYKGNMGKMSKLFKDRAVDPLENAVYWTEYILRQDLNDLSLLKPEGRKRTWIQRRLVDVYVLLGAPFLSVLVGVGFLLCSLVCSKTIVGHG